MTANRHAYCYYFFTIYHLSEMAINPIAIIQHFNWLRIQIGINLLNALIIIAGSELYYWTKYFLDKMAHDFDSYLFSLSYYNL